MYIITTKQKGSHTVVVGFRKQHIDPAATRAATVAALNEKGLPGYLTAAQEAVDSAVSLPARTQGRRKLVDAAHTVLMDNERRYAAECVAEQAKHVKYLPPKAGEVLMSEADAERLRDTYKNLKRKEYITLDGQIITDLVGREYWVESDGSWSMTTIAEFGETPPKGGKLYKDLNSNQHKAIADQKKQDDFDALTTGEKAERKSNAVRGAEIEAARRRSIEEIKGVDAEIALNNARDWLAAKLVEIEEKFR